MRALAADGLCVSRGRPRITEPQSGIGPETSFLPRMCSTTELLRRWWRALTYPPMRRPGHDSGLIATTVRAEREDRTHDLFFTREPLCH